MGSPGPLSARKAGLEPLEEGRPAGGTPDCHQRCHQDSRGTRQPARATVETTVVEIGLPGIARKAGLDETVGNLPVDQLFFTAVSYLDTS